MLARTKSREEDAQARGLQRQSSLAKFRDLVDKAKRRPNDRFAPKKKGVKRRSRMLENFETFQNTRLHVEGPTEIRRDTLHFNPAYFESKRAVMLSNRCHEVVRLAPMDRTAEDIKALRSYMQGLDSFSLYSPKMQIALCRVVRFEQFGPGRVIVRKGHRATSMYFISYGEVGIIQDEDTATFAAQFVPVTLKRGKCFGEVALANNTTRGATVVCMEYTELLVIDKEDFNELKLESYIKIEEDTRFRCFSSIEPLESFSIKSLRTLVYSTKTDWFPINTIIKQATDIADTCYFVIKGIIEVYRVVELNSVSGYLDDLEMRYYGRIFKRRAYDDKHKIIVKISTLHPNEYFMIDDNDKREFSILSQGAMVIRVRNEFLRKQGMHQGLLKNQNILPNDNQILDNFMTENEWNFYKRGLIQEVSRARRPSRQKRLKELEKCDDGIITITKDNKNTPFIHGINLPLFHKPKFQRQFQL
jgi:CRP-like cAMP-binding protein